MIYNPDIHHRRSIRLREYNYSGEGAYFVTICAWNREFLFGDVADGVLRLNAFGAAIDRSWQTIPAHFPHVELDAFVIMPNHFHAILHLTEFGQVGTSSPLRPHGTDRGSLGAIIQNFKSVSTRKINKLHNRHGPVWQRNYYERVIRNDKELARARAYVVDNPLKWDDDENNPVKFTQT